MLEDSEVCVDVFRCTDDVGSARVTSASSLRKSHDAGCDGDDVITSIVDGSTDSPTEVTVHTLMT